VAWNLGNAEAGLRFQLIDRHPWAFHGDGIWFVATQAVLVTPLLFVALGPGRLAAPARRQSRRALFRMARGADRLRVFALGFFADTERISYHWPLPGYVALLPLLPSCWRDGHAGCARRRRHSPRPGWSGLLGYYAVAATPTLARGLAGEKVYPHNFAAGLRLPTPCAKCARPCRPDTRIVADNFKGGAELGFALGDPDIAVLPHPLNRKHGTRTAVAPVGIGGPSARELGQHPLLLVVGTSEVEYKNLLAHYHALCSRLGPLPPPRVVNVDHGGQRFLLFALDRRPRRGRCTTPAMAWIRPPRRERPRRCVVLRVGWAFKDGVGCGVAFLLAGAAARLVAIPSLPMHFPLYIFLLLPHLTSIPSTLPYSLL
jgi:hypothetical protein